MLRIKPYSSKYRNRITHYFVTKRSAFSHPESSIYQTLQAIREHGNLIVGVSHSFVALGETEYAGFKSWKLESEEKLCVSLGIRVQELEREVNHLRAKAKSSGCSGLASREAFYHKRYP